MTKKKKNRYPNPDEVTVTASKADFTEAGTGIGLLCLWACSAFDMPPTLENAKAMYALAQTRARDAATACAFAKLWD
jgi:hypothetical protein